MELSLVSIIKILAESRRLVALVVAGSLAVALALCLSLPKFYGVEGLLEVPELGQFQNTSGGLEALMALKGGAASALLDATSGTPDKDVKSFLDFKYVDNPRSMWNQDPFIKSVDAEKTTNFVRVLALGKTYEIAQDFLEKATKEVYALFDEQLKLIRSDVEKKIALKTRQLQDVNQSLDKIQKSRQSLGFSPVLLKEESDLKQTKITLESSLLALQVGLSEYQMHNVRVINTRIFSRWPVYPKTLLILVATGFISFLLVANLVIFLRQPEVGALRGGARETEVLASQASGSFKS